MEAGLIAEVQLLTTPLGGYTGPLSITCTTDAPATTCPNSGITLDGTSVSKSTISIQTTSKYTVVGYGSVFWLSAAITGLLLLRRRKARSRLTFGLLCLVALAAVSASLTGCSGKYPSQNSPYTPAGAYTVTLMASDGFLIRSGTYQMTVTR